MNEVRPNDLDEKIIHEEKSSIIEIGVACAIDPSVN
jgi:hypothetical protein